MTTFDYVRKLIYIITKGIINSQRMLNALESGTVMPIHRHRNGSETVIVVKGSMKEYFYDDRRNVIKECGCPQCQCSYGTMA